MYKNYRILVWCVRFLWELYHGMNPATNQKSEHNQSHPNAQAKPALDKSIRTSTIFASKTASIAFLDLQGANGRKFHLPESVMRNILLPDYSNRNQHGMQESNNLLRRIHLQKVMIEPGTKNSFPFPIGIHISGIRGTEYTTSGECFTYILPGRHTVHTPKCIFESHGDEELMSTWEEDFAKWNNDNLETLCAMIVPESDIVMVHLQHPVVQLLDKKSEMFGTQPPSSQPTTTPNWRQVQGSTFHTACSWLRENILAKSSKTFDLSQMTIHFGKTDKTDFKEIPASCFTEMEFTGDEDVETLNQKKSKYSNILMQKPYILDIKLSLEYRFTAQEMSP